MNDKCIIKSNLIKSCHGFSTRLGGVSEGIFESLNLGMNRGDDREKVTENWNIFLDAADINIREFVCGKQIHSNIVHIAGAKDMRPAYGPGELIEADGYVTNERNVPLAIFVADCIPLLLEDTINGVIGAVHCGWRGTVADIEKNAIDAMAGLGAEPKNITAAIGPAIERCCFEVGEEVIDAAKQLIGEEECISLYTDSKKNSGKYMLDLKAVLRARLLQLGLREENIDMVGGCTMCSPNRYYSHRYSNGARGSLACVIMQ